MDVINDRFWQGRRVLVTGHTGFKGSWLTLWLARMGADVTGIALPPDEGFGLYRMARVDRCCASIFVDIRDRGALHTAVVAARPEVVFHLAAQPLVRASYAAPVETWSVNVMGTIHLMDALRDVPDLRALVVVTSDKCYAHAGDACGAPFAETASLGGHDPYSSSKAGAEIAVASWAASFFDAQRVGVATARAGNVIGAGDAGLDRLVPDLVRASRSGSSVAIRYPDAIRPWQHVTDPLRGYLLLAEALAEAPFDFRGGWNFGPMADDGLTVVDVAERFATAFGHPACWHIAEDASLHEAATLALDSTKARVRLGWQASVPIDEAIAMTADGYRALLAADEDLSTAMLAQIERTTAGIEAVAA